MVGEGTVAGEVLRGDGGCLGERNRATDARVVSVFFDKRPHGITIATIEPKPSPWAARSQILLSRRDILRQDDLLVLGFE